MAFLRHFGSGRYSSPRLSMSRREFPRIRRSRETGTIDSPIEETARADTGSAAVLRAFCAEAFTAFAMVRRTRAHTSEGSSSSHPGRGRTISYSS